MSQRATLWNYIVLCTRCFIITLRVNIPRLTLRNILVNGISEVQETVFVSFKLRLWTSRLSKQNALENQKDATNFEDAFLIHEYKQFMFLILTQLYTKFFSLKHRVHNYICNMYVALVWCGCILAVITERSMLSKHSVDSHAPLWHRCHCNGIASGRMWYFDVEHFSELTLFQRLMQRSDAIFLNYSHLYLILYKNSSENSFLCSLPFLLLRYINRKTARLSCLLYDW